MADRVFSAGACCLLFAGALLLTAWPSGDVRGASVMEREVGRRLAEALVGIEQLGRCPAYRSIADRRVAAVALAIVSGEDTLRNPVERLVEDAVVQAGLWLDLTPPDVSLGAAQIAPSHYAALRGSQAGYWATVSEPCASLAFASDWIAANALPVNNEAARRKTFSAWSGHPPYDPVAGNFYASAAYYRFSERLFRVAASI
jgi:hypothetical protein